MPHRRYKLRDLLLSLIVLVITIAEWIGEKTIILMPSAPGRYSDLFIELALISSCLGLISLFFGKVHMSRLLTLLGFLFWLGVILYFRFFYHGPMFL
jgi:hypothetical protein